MPSFNQSQVDAAPFGLIGMHVIKASATLPATTTQHLFVIAGGRVWISVLFGMVTTIIQNSDPVIKVTGTPTVGTAVDIASTVDITSLEVGGFIVVEGDGTALIKGNAGAGLPGTGVGWFLANTGYIDLITGATKTGATKWDLFYVPVDDGAFVVTA